MNHILLPGRGDLDQFNAPARYGINAMELLINAIMGLGGVRSRLKAKVFGGAHLLAAISLENGTGHLNVEFVEQFLRTERIKLVARDTGGRRSRQIWFHSDTGEVLVKGSPVALDPDVAKAEHRLVKRQRQAVDQSTEITLFE
jgi:chemotaxis protein CheD